MARQAAERGGELGVRLRHLLQVAALHRSASLARASDTSVKTVCSCFAYAFDRLDQIGDEIGAPLQLHLDLRCRGVHLLVVV